MKCVVCQLPDEDKYCEFCPVPSRERLHHIPARIPNSTITPLTSDTDPDDETDSHRPISRNDFTYITVTFRFPTEHEAHQFSHSIARHPHWITHSIK